MLPAPLERVFAFFAAPENLEVITPPWLRFRILTPRPIVMAVGLKIDYRISMRGVPMRWRSVITAYEPGRRFVDEQVKGPYRMWVHEHTFEPTGSGGTLVRDRVRYALPRVPGSSIVHRWLVKPDLQRIFAYRKERIAALVHEA